MFGDELIKPNSYSDTEIFDCKLKWFGHVQLRLEKGPIRKDQKMCKRMCK